MTSPDKIEHRIRLTSKSSAAAKQAAHDGYVSLNAWVQEAVDEKLSRSAEAQVNEQLAKRYPEGSPLRDLARRGQVTPATKGGLSMNEIRRRTFG